MHRNGQNSPDAREVGKKTCIENREEKTRESKRSFELLSKIVLQCTYIQPCKHIYMEILYPYP
jgi:ribosome biogenesis protein Nip4